MDQCIYHKITGSKICFLLLYVDDIFFTSNDKEMIHDMKQFLSKTIDMKDMGDVSYVIGIKIHRHRTRYLRFISRILYQQNYREV